MWFDMIYLYIFISRPVTYNFVYSYTCQQLGALSLLAILTPTLKKKNLPLNNIKSFSFMYIYISKVYLSLCSFFYILCIVDIYTMF